ncbi:MAG: DUF2809 domain-containing protein [Acidobacteria bacterium]|nr:DUF2809 domain-containing protein [Acidobacteriota bacterium]
MLVRLRSRRSWVICVAGIIAAGIFSRLVHTGWVILDKYLGDALYAAMVYGILRLKLRPTTSAPVAALAMAAIELFQLTGIPARLFASESLVVRLIARLMGTEFSVLDLAAYAVGIAGIHLVDRLQPRDPVTGQRN